MINPIRLWVEFPFACLCPLTNEEPSNQSKYSAYRHFPSKCLRQIVFSNNHLNIDITKGFYDTSP